MISYQFQQQLAMYAAIRRNANFYDCSDNMALAYIPPEWATYRTKYGYPCPSEERFNRIISGRDTF